MTSHTKSRPLTDTEIIEAQKIFSDGIDYTRVTLHCGHTFLPLRKTAIAPNGKIHFPAPHFHSNYTHTEPHYLIWLIHELTHIWQYQNGYSPLLGGLFLACQGGYYQQRAYHYPHPSRIAHFNQLNMEQQADFLAHYYAASHLGRPIFPSDQNHHIQRILKPFFQNPRDFSLLPTYFSHLGRLKNIKNKNN